MFDEGCDRCDLELLAIFLFSGRPSILVNAISQ